LVEASVNLSVENSSLLSAVMLTVSYWAFAQPSRPDNVMLEETTDRSISISWDESDGAVRFYHVYVNETLDGSLDMDLLRNGETNNIDINLFYDETSGSYKPTSLMLNIKTSYTAYGLDGETVYSLEVEAEDRDGNKSPKSTAVTSTTEKSEITKSVLYPSYDTYTVGADQNVNANPQTDYSGSYSLYTRSRNGFDGWHTLYRGFMQFDLSELDNQENIFSAQLKVYYISAGADPQAQKFYETSDDTPFFSNKNPVDDIGADIEGNLQKDLMLLQDTVDSHDPVFTFQPIGYERPDGVDEWTEGWGWGVIDITEFIKNAAASSDDDLLTFTWAPEMIDNNTRLRIVSSDAPMFKPELIIEQVIVASSESTLTQEVQLYPNPALQGERLNLRLGQVGEFNVDIVNLSGQLLASRQIKATRADQSVAINNLDLNSGIYFAKIHGVAFSKSFKFIIK